jgi:hypothetical protein
MQHIANTRAQPPQPWVYIESYHYETVVYYEKDSEGEIGCK